MFFCTESSKWSLPNMLTFVLQNIVCPMVLLQSSYYTHRPFKYVLKWPVRIIGTLEYLHKVHRSKKCSQTTLTRSWLFFTTYTDPLCQIFSKIVLMAKLLQNNSNLNDFEYSRYLKAKKIFIKAQFFLKAKKTTTRPNLCNLDFRIFRGW